MRLKLALTVVSLGTILGCSPGTESGPGAADSADSELRRGNGGEPGSLDPALAEDIHAFAVLADLYEGLVTTDAAGKIIPGVASTWTASADATEYTFTLRADAHWSNGDPVVAQDFVRAYRHVASPDTPASYAFLLEPIHNFRRIKTGKLPAGDLGVSAVDSTTLKIKLEQPTPYLLSVLTMPIASPRHAATTGAVPVNGAYTLAERAPMDVIRLVRNPHFHATDSVQVATVEYYPIVDENAELNRFRAGELDITQTIPASQLAMLRERMPRQVRTAPMLGLYYLAFDLTEAPLGDAELRKALSLAIDRHALVTLTGRGELPAFGIVPPGVADYDGTAYEWAVLADDARLDLARDHYARAGFSETNPLKLTLLYDAGGAHETIAVAVADMWREALGVEVAFDKREWVFFLEARNDKSEWDVMRFSWFGDFDDPATFIDIFRSDNAQNLPGYSSPRFDDLARAAANESDLDRRRSTMAEAETVLLDDYAIAPLYFYVSKHLLAPSIRGFEDNVLDRHPSRFISLEPTNAR